MTKSELLGIYRTSLNNCTLVYASMVLWAYPDTPAFFEALYDGMDIPKPHSDLLPLLHDGKVLKIASDGKATTVLRSTSPWSPTGVALSGKDLYVLEYLHTPGEDRRQWIPRVRKVASDGSVTTVATIDRK